MLAWKCGKVRDCFVSACAQPNAQWQPKTFLFHLQAQSSHYITSKSAKSLLSAACTMSAFDVLRLLAHVLIV